MSLIRYHSTVLKELLPLLQEYYGFCTSMIWDEMMSVTPPNITFDKEGKATFDVVKTFLAGEYFFDIEAGNYDADSLTDALSKYFFIEEEELKTDVETFFCLYCITGIYYKKKAGSLDSPDLYLDADIEYKIVLNERIYPEMMALYKMILEAKQKKGRGNKVTILFKQNKIEINTAAWFLDDMEQYFKKRFPDVTLDDINKVQPIKGKAGRKFNNVTTNTLIWGTYNLLKKHHSMFKDSQKEISNEVCEFIIQFLDYLGIENDFIITDIRDWLKHMKKQGFTPNWHSSLSYTEYPIKEKEPEDPFERMNQPQRKYDLSAIVK